MVRIKFLVRTSVLSHQQSSIKTIHPYYQRLFRAMIRQSQILNLKSQISKMSHLVDQTFGGAADAQQLEKAQQQVDTVLRFFEGSLGD
jgi:hypothetical protein